MLTGGSAIVHPKLLLPAATFWDNLWCAIQGVWHVATDPTQRQAFEQAISRGVIKDAVLQNAYNGSIMTFSLFWNLQNPLWKRGSGASFDAQEFTTAAGPALTNFHDILNSFQNQMRKEYEEFQKQHQEEEATATAAQDSTDNETSDNSAQERQETIASLPPMVDLAFLGKLLRQSDISFLKQPHAWRQQADDDADSLAGRLSRMTTPECLDAFCASSKLGLTVTDHVMYQEGSTQVGQVAILSARAMEIPLPGQIDDKEPDYRHEEFKATEQANLKMGVAAQIDVLFEITNRFLEEVPDVGRMKIEDGGLENVPMKTEHVEYTSLAVTVFEGWLDNGEDGKEKEETEGLRWRVPLMREAIEFPMTVSTMRVVLDDVDIADTSSTTGSSDTNTGRTNSSDGGESVASQESKTETTQTEVESKTKEKDTSSSS